MASRKTVTYGGKEKAWRPFGASFFVRREETTEDGASNSGIRQNVFRPRLVSKQQIVLTPAVTFLNGSKRASYVDLSVFPNLQSNAEEQVVHCSRWLYFYVIAFICPQYVENEKLLSLA